VPEQNYKFETFLIYCHECERKVDRSVCPPYDAVKLTSQ